MPEPVTITPPDLFEPDPAQARQDEAPLERLAQPMDELCDKLSGAVTGRTEVVTSDAALMTRVDALRKALEISKGQRLTFRGEARPEVQGPVIRGEVDVKKVLGYAAGVAAGEITGKVTVDGRVLADEVATGASAIGTKVDSVSGPW
jgi:allophanate hydrolase subunit 2